MDAATYALSISSFSFFFCCSALFASALAGSSSANAGIANDVIIIIAAAARTLISISRTDFWDRKRSQLGHCPVWCRDSRSSANAVRERSFPHSAQKEGPAHLAGERRG